MFEQRPTYSAQKWNLNKEDDVMNVLKNVIL